jgi:UDP-N-acetylmuramoyl-tripeptide--D-alanyl-D-alanine ligase
MNPSSISTIAEMSGARLLTGNPESTVIRVCKDTRTVCPGDLYIALRGENFDGNRFIAEAAAKGAVGALCDAEAPSGLPVEFGILGTADALTGLTYLASAWRSRLNLRPVVVTGSSGKTSVKDFTATVLGSRFRTTATKGNLNNQIGLPLSILDANLEDEAAVWEIGMNHRGEIAPLAGLAKPEIGIITGIGTAHIEFLGSQEEIAQEKGDLLERLPNSGAAIIPAEDSFAGELRNRTRARVLGVGFVHGDLRAVSVRQEIEGSRFFIEGEFGRAEAFLPVPGRHMIGNALMAVAAGLLSGISLDDCVAVLANVALASGRLGRVVKRGVNILDDTYNANPDSMVAALETLHSMPSSGRRIAVLGKMGELGIHASEGYRRVGEKAAVTLDTLICVGSEAEAIGVAAGSKGLQDVKTVAGNGEAAQLLSSLSREGDLVLLKASRSARLEEVLHQFI